MAQQQQTCGMHAKKPSHSRVRGRSFSALHPQASSSSISVPSLVMMRKQNHQTDMGSLRRSLRRRSRECSVRVAVDGNSNSSSSPAGAGGGTSTTTSSSSSSSAACDKYFDDDTRPIVLFDGVCMLCIWCVQLLKSILNAEGLTQCAFVSLRSDSAAADLHRL